MTTYLITGASRGLGYAFLIYLSRNPSNTVIGLVRNTTKTLEKIQADNLNTASNIHVIEADIASYSSLLTAYSKTEAIVSKIDILINNAAALTTGTAKTKLSSHQDDPETLLSELRFTFDTNVVGVISTINIFLPLVLKSDTRKVIAISSGLADDSVTNKYDMYEAAPYSISKAALNTVIAKYNAAHGKNTDGVLFLSISPGLVDTGNQAARESFTAFSSCRFIVSTTHLTWMSMLVLSILKCKDQPCLSRGLYSPGIASMALYSNIMSTR